jgi:hypothetical protein
MSTNWALPSIVEQYSEAGAENVHVSWEEVNNFNSLKNKDGKSIKTSRDLLHIARDPRHDIKEKTYFLRCTGFNFINLPQVVSGIELRISSNRGGRIIDDTIQLCLNEELIGDNFANLTIDPLKVYGNDIETWNSNLSMTNIQDSTFGIVVRFQSHPNWPHKCSVFLDSIELRVH